MELACFGKLDQTTPVSLRVLHVIPSVAPARGGPSQAVVDMVAALNKKGVNAEIATTNDNGDSELDVQLGKLVDFNGAPSRFFKRYASRLPVVREFQYSWGFNHWLKQHIDDYDVIHVHAIFSACSTYAMWLARKRAIPYIVRPIGQLETWSLRQSAGRKKFYLRLVENANLRGAHAVHFTARSEAEQAMKLLPEIKCQTVPLGVRKSTPISNAALKLRKRYSLGSTAPIIISVSRLHPKKGLDLLIEALADISSPWVLLIAGDGDSDYLQKLQSMITEADLQNRIKLVGFVRNLDKQLLMQGADLFTLTSHSENFGIAVLEALEAGTPVLVTEAVALAEEVQQHGLGCVAETNVASIRAALIDALEKIEDATFSPDDIRHHVAQNYQWSTVAGKLKQIYLAAIDRSHADAAD